MSEDQEKRKATIDLLKATIGDIDKFAKEHGLKPITFWKKEIDIDKILIDPDGTKTLEDFAKETNGFPTQEQIELAAKAMARESGNDLTDCAFIAIPYLLSKGKIKLPRKKKSRIFPALN